MTHEEPTTGDLLHAISRLDEKIERVIVQTTRTNGRVDKLQEQEIERQKREAVAIALAAATGQVFLTKRQMAAGLGGVGLLFTAAQLAMGFIK